MNCTYTYKGTAYKSYQDLVRAIKDDHIINYENESDIIFSKANQKQEKIASAIANLQAIPVKSHNKMAYDDGEPYWTSKDCISSQELIDTPVFYEKTHITSLSRDGYIEHKAAQFVKDGVSPTLEEGKRKATLEVDNWDMIAADATQLHTIISKIDDKTSTYEFNKQLKDTKFKNVSNALKTEIDNTKISIFSGIKKKNSGRSSQAFFNVNLTAKLRDMPKDIFGHIDMCIVDADGDLHIYNYKVTTSGINMGSVKMEKYRYQMALLKQMLAAHGISVNNATLHIIPVRMVYNDDLSAIDSISVQKPEELTVINDRYVFKKYDDAANYFIPAHVDTDKLSDEDLDNASKDLQAIFPERDIQASGIQISAQEWIKKNRGNIKESTDPKYGYILYIDEDHIYNIEDRTVPEKNKEIIEILEEHSEKLSPENDIVLKRVVKDVKAGLTDGTSNFLSNKAYSKTGLYLHKVFSPYFAINKDTPSGWELIDNDVLLSANILLFKNKASGQINTVILSGMDLDAMIRFKRGTNILGSRLYDTKSGSLVNYKSNMGTIEAVRAMTLLNRVLPKISGDKLLGSLKVVSLQGRGQSSIYNMETLNKECFSKIIQEVNQIKTVNIHNNFIGFKYVDQFETLVQDYKDTIADSTLLKAETQELLDTGFGELQDAKTVEARLTALRSIQKTMEENYPAITNNLEASLKSKATKKIALLYADVLKAITYYNVGEINPNVQALSSIDKNVFVSSRVPNSNFRIITDLYNRALNTIAEKAVQKWIPIRSFFKTFYDEIGYSRLQNSILGNQAKQFQDLYKRDSQGNNTLELLNPYNPNEMAQIKNDGKKNAKQQFLKRILFEFAKIKYPNQGIQFDFTSADDPKLQEFIKKHGDTYFQIPLEKASISTRRTIYPLSKKLEYIKESATALLRNPKQAFDEFVQNVTSPEDQELRDQSWRARQLQNSFQRGDSKERNNYIAAHGADYFETNLEVLLADYIERDIETKEYNKALVTIKGVLFQLNALASVPNKEKIIKQTISMIDDFVKVNMFHMSVMEKTSQKILGFLTPLKRMVSNTLIAGNITSMLRDTFEGCWQNTMRTINHYQTDISAKSLMKAYKTVIKNSFTDGRSINIVNQLCQIYRLSNIDISRISEGLKSGRGISNIGNWAYATLRRPDFLNRMTLFVAKCYEDGVYDAFDIKDGELVYDWKKDKRFSIYASGDTSNKEYYNQQGAYYNAIRAYNREHPDATLNYTDNLPMPYSLQEVEEMKNVANSIYGAYDRSTRAAYEHMALGTFFGMYSTWMNGIYANYMMKPGQYTNGSSELVQDRDSAGNLKFLDDTGQVIVQYKSEDGTIKYFYDGTVKQATENLTHIKPLMHRVPIVIQGIYYTLKDTLRALNNGDFKSEIWVDPVQRRNLLKLGSDLLAFLIFSILYGCAIDPSYRNFKKDMKNRDVLTNATVELVYKSSSRSYDGFKGVFNVFQFLGENTNPPIYSQNLKLIKQTLGVIAGKRSVSDLINNNVAVLRAFQDTRNAYNKSQQ